jgi:uroporphyrinogen decarboxylase
MTSRERINAAVRRRKPDRVPCDISWGMTPGALETFRAHTGHESYHDYFHVDIRWVAPAATRKPNDYSRYHAPGVSVGEWGIGSVSGGPGSHHFQHIVSPLRSATTVEEIDDYPLPDIDAPYRLEPMAAEVRALHDRGLAAGGAAAVTIYEMAWQIRGIEETLADMVMAPELVDCLFERIMLIRIPMIVAMVRAGCDVLILGDDVSTQHGMVMSPALWRRFLKPRMARIISEAKRASPDLPVFYHSDGDCR